MNCGVFQLFVYLFPNRIHKELHTKGGWWPPQEFGYLWGGYAVVPRIERSEP